MSSFHPNEKTRVVFDIDKPFITALVELFDENDVKLTEYTLTASELSQNSFKWIIDATHNDIAESALGMRTARLTATDEDGIKESVTHRYYLVAPVSLVKGDNSLLSFVDALMLVPSLTNLHGWEGADDDQRKSALQEAYSALGSFILSSRFSMQNNKVFPYQYITEYNKLAFENLADRVQKDFQKAQLLHANYLLGGEEEKALRDTGVMSKSVGESTTFFRTSKPLSYGISDRAYRYISRYLDRDVRLGKA